MLFVKLLRVITPVLLLLNISSVNSARILVSIAVNSFSHQAFYRPLWKELAKRGHELVIITSHPMNDPSIKNIREISTSASNKMFEDMTETFMSSHARGDKWRYLQTLRNATEHHLSHPEIKHLFDSKDEHFDLIMMEYVIPTLAMLKHRFQVPTIALTSTDAHGYVHGYVGNPKHEIMYPNIMADVVKERNFIDRVKTLYYKIIAEAFLIVRIRDEAEVVQKVLGPGYPTFTEVESNVDMLFANFNPMFADIRPKSDATVDLCGLHIEEPKPLPKDLQKYLDASTNGVIYMSLGTNIKTEHLTNETFEMFLETFRQLPYNVIWKAESENIPNKPDNVKIVKWLPQQDVLSHKNIIAFVTQGGLHSLEEALMAHVPVVVFPYLFDQEHNAKHVAMNGLGISMDPLPLTVQTFKAALLEVITNPKFKQTVIKQANILKDKPMTALERAVWWTEYVLRHKGAKHLHGSKIPLYQELYLDVISFLIVAGLLIFTAIYFISKSLHQKVSKLYGSKTKYE